jgi:anti-sigma factor RsiW
LPEHLTQTQIEDYGRRRLSAEESLSVSRHMRDCETCRLNVERLLDEAFYALRFEVFGAAAEAVISVAEPSHLNFELTAAYIDEALAGEELQVVKDHLAGCERCAVAADDLRAFRNRIAPELDIEYRPPFAQAANGNRWRRLFMVARSLLRRSPALVVYSGLAALLIIAASLQVLQKMEREGKNPETARATPPPSAPAVTASPDSTQEGMAIIARLNDGAGQVALSGDGKVSGIDHLPLVYRRMIEKALTSQQLEKSPLLADLAKFDILSMRSANKQGAEFSVIEPVKIVVLSDRPTFRWSPLAGATGYTVEVYDDQFNRIIISPQGADTSWTATQPLKRGGIYYWQVKAVRDGEQFISPRRPAALPIFRILDEELANELDRALRAYASSHLTLALIYTRAGLLDDAEREFHELQKANPNSAISRQLLVSLRAMRR